MDYPTLTPSQYAMTARAVALADSHLSEALALIERRKGSLGSDARADPQLVASVAQLIATNYQGLLTAPK